MVNVTVPDYVIQELKAKGVINEKALRNCEIRQRFKDIRLSGIRPKEARLQLAREYGLRECSIMSILYRRTPRKRSTHSFSSII